MRTALTLCVIGTFCFFFYKKWISNYLASTFCFAFALYDKSDSVIELTASNFISQVIKDDSTWIVEFYAPWYFYFYYL